MKRECGEAGAQDELHRAAQRRACKTRGRYHRISRAERFPCHEYMPMTASSRSAAPFSSARALYHRYNAVAASYGAEAIARQAAI